MKKFASKKNVGKTLTILMMCIVTLLSSGMIFPTSLPTSSSPLSLTVSAANGRAFNQWDSKWYNVSYNGSNLHDSGCGIFSFGNAIYALNGNIVDVKAIAQKTATNGSWGGSGGKGVKDREKFFNTLSSYSNTYNFTMGKGQYSGVDSTSLINHLKNGGVAVAHVDNHFIAIVGYNQNNKTYHVIESAEVKRRGLSADSWVSTAKLKNGATKVDWFILISKKNNNSQQVIKTYTMSKGNTPVYTDPSFKTQKGTIYGSDEIYIYKSTNSYLYVTYPISGTSKRKDGYIRTSAVLQSTNRYTRQATRQIQTYKRPQEKYGYISAGDKVWVYGTKGVYTQVCYPVGQSNGQKIYKCGWILTSNVQYLK